MWFKNRETWLLEPRNTWLKKLCPVLTVIPSLHGRQEDLLSVLETGDRISGLDKIPRFDDGDYLPWPFLPYPRIYIEITIKPFDSIELVFVIFVGQGNTWMLYRYSFTFTAIYFCISEIVIFISHMTTSEASILSFLYFLYF